MSTLLLVNIAIIFIFSILDFSKTTTQIRLSGGNNVSVFDYHGRRKLQNPLDLRKRAQKPFNKKRENRPRHIERPKRISAGIPADISEFPFMASLVMVNQELEPMSVLSTAVIVTNQWLITHFERLLIPDPDGNIINTYVRILYHNPNQEEGAKSVHQIKTITEILSMPSGQMLLIQVERPLKVRFYQVAYFPTDFDYNTNSYVKVVGWGINTPSKPNPNDVDTLRYTFTTLIQCDFRNIEEKYRPMFICTRGGVTCAGDDSAALVQDRLVIGVLVRRQPTCGKISKTDTDMYIKSKYLIEFISEYVDTHINYY